MSRLVIVEVGRMQWDAICLEAVLRESLPWWPDRRDGRVGHCGFRERPGHVCGETIVCNFCLAKMNLEHYK